jgi:hypothetical protein
VTPGQGKVTLTGAALATVKAGVGKRQTSPDAYVLRAWRGNVSAFLRREHAVTAETLAVIVYTRQAYLQALHGNDTPAAVRESEQAALARDYNASHVIVAVLAGAGPDSLSPGRLVSNLAGGNKDADAWDAATIREKARAAAAYAAEWDVVSD